MNKTAVAGILFLVLLQILQTTDAEGNTCSHGDNVKKLSQSRPVVNYI